MKILYAITKSNWGGAQRYVYELAKGAQDLGHDVTVVLGGSGILAQKLQKSGVKVISIPYLGRDVSPYEDVRSFISIFEIIKEINPDVLHINSSKMGGLGGLCGRILGVKKIIYTGHGWEFNGPRPTFQKPIIKFFSWLTLIFAHHTICVSEKTKKDVYSWPFLKNKLSVVYNGINSFDQLSREEARSSLSIPLDKKVVGTITELRRIKGPDLLIQAWSKYKKRDTDLLVIIGEGEERENLKKLSITLGVENSVKFLGFVEDARNYIKAFDVYTLPSRSEALAYVLLEAGIAKLPVIATSVGGVPEIIRDGETGILIPTENPEALTKAIEKLFEDKTTAGRLAENLYNFVKTNFNIERMIGDTIRTYAR